MTGDQKPLVITPGYRSWMLLLIVLINTCNFVDRTVLGVLAPAIKKELMLSDTQIGMLGGLMFAIFYTTLGVPIAAGIAYPAFGLLLSPMVASAAMAFSSVSVIGNALRLRSVEL